MHNFLIQTKKLGEFRTSKLPFRMYSSHSWDWYKYIYLLSVDTGESMLPALPSPFPVSLRLSIVLLKLVQEPPMWTVNTTSMVHNSDIG